MLTRGSDDVLKNEPQIIVIILIDYSFVNFPGESSYP